MIETVVRLQDAAERLGVSSSTIKRYERAGALPPAKRSLAGHRVYSESDLQEIQRVLVPDTDR